MINKDCKHLIADDKLTIKDLLIAGFEGVACLACTIGMLVIAWGFAG